MRIRHLPDYLVNQIAAGEVIERPAAALKELIENSIDAGASQLDIQIEEGGKSLIRIKDNGFGMSAEELEAATERHATSKLPDDDLVNINHLGFRGEALPSIGSVSRLKIQSREKGADEAWEINVEGGKKSAPFPTAQTQGTTIEVRDLFYATPARLKFLKTERAEYAAIKEMVLRIAMAFPSVGFTLSHNGDSKLNLLRAAGDLFDQRQARLQAILGKEFSDNALNVSAERESIKISGLASLPTFNRATNQYQYLFVNGRPVKDRMLLGCVRAAYMDVLHHGRHPYVVLFIEIPPAYVDVNVHPAKAEVRFRDAGHVRGLLISSLKQALLGVQERGGIQSTSSTLAVQALNKMGSGSHGPSSGSTLPYHRGASAAVPPSYISGAAARYGNLAEKNQNFYAPQNSAEANFMALPPSARHEEMAQNIEEIIAHPLGAARAQIHENYIIAQSESGLVIVDQHAAHERMVYEKLKAQMAENGVTRQGLLVPEIIDLDDTQIMALEDNKDTLYEFGLEIENFGNGSIAVQALPALMGEKVNIKKLIHDIIDEIKEHDTVEKLQKTLFDVLSSAACHGSIRSGRRMNADEMNALLRQMENTQNSGHCNHGRPTYIKLDLTDIEKLFGRR